MKPPRLARTVCLVVLLLLALAAPGRAVDPEPTRTVTLMVQWRHQAQFAGYYLAQERGLYRERGLDVKILRGGPDRSPIESLEKGESDFITLFLTGAIGYRAQGIPVTNLAQVVNQSNLMLVARKDHGIEKLADLEGKRVSLWGEPFRAAFMGYLGAEKVSPTIVPQYYSVNLFLMGGVDACAAMAYNEYHVLRQSGLEDEDLSTFKLRDRGFGFPEDGIYCLESSRTANPRLCENFAQASLEGWRQAAGHPEEAIEAVMRYVREDRVPTNRAHMKWMLETILPTIIPGRDDPWRLGELSRGDYEKTVAAMVERGLIASAPTYDEFAVPAKEATRAP